MSQKNRRERKYYDEPNNNWQRFSREYIFSTVMYQGFLGFGLRESMSEPMI